MSTALVALMPDVADSAIQLLDAPGLAKLELFAREAKRVQALPVSVSNGVEAVAAVETMTSVTAAIKELEALRSQFCDPLRKQWEDSRAIFKAPLETLEAIAGKDGKLRRALNAWNVAENARIDAERRRLERERQEAELAEAKARVALEEAETAEARKAASEAAAVALEAQRKATVEAPLEVKGVRSGGGTYSGRKVWVVAGIHDLSKVPEQYLKSERVMVALTAELNAAVRSGARDIPGVTIEEHTEGSFRARK